ncbi:RNA-binding protein Rsf1-like [Limulus polyphemus]|uniref:RNA-binding protein Rsf1-like n=1 Tax=Limulus polyphemus TaxID=6850 RepID=A0ABM1BR41_LIMPO|nr:RNA-binding protein Rsf1-like [Limulus polyphemus]XP_013787028.1 RNA-binding protein Rsf1-like [Limulus polyphemus]
MNRRDSGTRVFVGGLTEDIQKEDLEMEFEKVGKIVSVWVAQNPPGFGFVEFDDREDANEAINAMNGHLIKGARIRVEMSRGKRGGRGGGRGRGGFRGGRGGGFRGGDGDYDRRGPSYDSYRGDGNFSRRGGGYRSNDGRESPY